MRFRLALLLSALAGLGAPGAAQGPATGAAPDPASDVEAGRRLYTEGVLPSGEPLRATVRGDVPVAGPQAACVACHRRSGLGTVESGTIALPVAGDVLFRPVWRGRPEMEMARTTGLNARPAYTDESLARAMVEGIGANGRALGPTMPRYALAEADARRLITYLKTLSSAPSPGADGATIRFATVVAGDVPPERRKALVDVVQTFVREKNAGTRYEDRRRTRPPMDMEFEYIRYRDWIVDVWTLSGPPASWRAQLDAAYRKQPVFAVLSGIAEGAWAPIDAFCEATRLPCLFPVTDLPVVAGEGFYNVYFTRGMTLEGALLAAFCESRPEEAPGGIVQVYREGRPGATAAAALLGAAARGRARVTQVALGAEEAASAAFWESLAGAHPGATLALWLEEADLASLAALGSAAPGPARVFLSSSLVSASAAAVPGPLRPRARLVHPYERPEGYEQRVRRTRTWLNSRKIADPLEERTQAGVFFALSIVNEALMHNYNFFVREYLVEQLESMASAMVVTAGYPRVTLGAGQRFGSRGGFILRLGEGPGAPARSLSEWIVP